MWLFRSIILALAIALTNTLPLDSVSPLPELENGGVHWAFLVAGSNGWANYRHQADICHAYQVLHKNGIPDDRIVVMMYDDIAFNEANPQKGIVINQIHGPDVYKGVPKDYTGKAVNADVFLKVLQGDKEAVSKIGSGKVINSGPYDNIFVFVATHGAHSFLTFPDRNLPASYFIYTLNNMYTHKKYAKMVIYIESFFSGSIFQTLPTDINILGMTSTNAFQRFYPCIFDKDMNTCVGDYFSIAWILDSDKGNHNSEIIHEQYEFIKSHVSSDVQIFGNMSILGMKVCDFQCSDYPTQTGGEYITIPSPIINEHDLISHIFHNITENITQETELHTSEEITNLKCYEEAVEYFFHRCSRNINGENVLGDLKTLVNLCNGGFPIWRIKAAIDCLCNYHPLCVPNRCT